MIKELDFQAMPECGTYMCAGMAVMITKVINDRLYATIIDRDGGVKSHSDISLQELKNLLGVNDAPITHKVVPQILSIFNNPKKKKMSVYLYGAAGAGKNVICQQIAEELGLKFYFATSVQDRFDLLGYSDALGKYVSTEFYQAFTEGGLFMLDEMDNSCENALITMNSALANGYITFPIHGRKEAHPDFKVIAAGNTSGTGANELYTGRRPLDAATLNRFVFLEVGYDKRIEMKCADGDSELVEFIRDCRRSAKDASYPFVASYRNIEYITALKDSFTMRDCLKMCLTKGMGQDEIGIIHNGLRNKRNKYAQCLYDLYNTVDDEDED